MPSGKAMATLANGKIPGIISQKVPERRLPLGDGLSSLQELGEAGKTAQGLEDLKP